MHVTTCIHFLLNRIYTTTFLPFSWPPSRIFVYVKYTFSTCIWNFLFTMFVFCVCTIHSKSCQIKLLKTLLVESRAKGIFLWQGTRVPGQGTRVPWHYSSADITWNGAFDGYLGPNCAPEEVNSLQKYCKLVSSVESQNRQDLWTATTWERFENRCSLRDETRTFRWQMQCTDTQNDPENGCRVAMTNSSIEFTTIFFCFQYIGCTWT